MKFSEELDIYVAKEWEAMLAHPFLKQVYEHTIPRPTFFNWVRQDYLFVQGAIPFLGLLISKAPPNLSKILGEAVVELHKELTLFEEMATKLKINFATLTMSPTCHSYLSFLMSSVYRYPFPCGWTVLYCAEKAYFDCWSLVKSKITSEVSWQPFIDRWSSEGFKNWVNFLADELNKMAEEESETTKAQMKELYKTTTRYEYLFWDLALEGGGWPV